MRTTINQEIHIANRREKAADNTCEKAAYGTHTYNVALRESYYQMGIRHGLMLATCCRKRGRI